MNPELDFEVESRLLNFDPLFPLKTEDLLGFRNYFTFQEDPRFDYL
jgi:hypothetical protein